MGVYGCMKFAQRNGLVKSQPTATKGSLIPVAVDLWNVMYGLMEKLYPTRDDGCDDSVSTLRCLFSLFEFIHTRSYFPIFVFDGGIHGEMRSEVGAKAIVAKVFGAAAATTVGSGRMACQGCAKQQSMTDRPHGRFGGTSALQSSTTRGKRRSAPKRSCDNRAIEKSCADPQHGGMVKSPSEQPQRFRCTASRWSSKPETPRIMHKLCVGIIRHLGYAYVESAYAEADDVCANLYHTRAVSYVVSSDTDLLLMGCDIVVDITQFFPAVIRCADVLNSLDMDYPTFLAKFVRCHTDLHREPVLKSMQEIVDVIRRRPGIVPPATVPSLPPEPHKEDCGEKEDNEGFILVKAKGRKNKRSARFAKLDPLSCSPVRSGVAKRRPGIDEPRVPRNGWRSLGEVCAQEDFHLTATKALQQLPPAKTLCEVLERRFIKHVVDILTPERRTSRVSILKRVPIMQEPRDDLVACELIAWTVCDPKICHWMCRTACSVPAVAPYVKALAAYWA